MNVVMTASGRFVEVQGTAEGQAFSRGELDELLDLAEGGIDQIVALQNEAVATPPAAAVSRPARPGLGQPGQGRPRSPRSSATAWSCCPGRPVWPTWSRTPTPSRATPG